METDRPKQFQEKTVFRSGKFQDDNEFTSPSRTGSGLLNARKLSRSRASVNDLSNIVKRGGSAAPLRNSKLNRSQDNIDWVQLGEKIEDWFGYAKTPDQRVVYKFLNNINNEDDSYSVLSDGRPCSSAVINHDKTQSLEDILDNLKKYRNKFNKSQSKSAKPVRGLPTVGKDGKNEDLDQMFESSTWRVMRHLKSADIRNKYPLPKANPDYHFRNATVFQVAGRAPKSTFLLHPDWV